MALEFQAPQPSPQALGLGPAAGLPSVLSKVQFAPVQINQLMHLIHVSCVSWAVLSLTTPANYCYALRNLCPRSRHGGQATSVGSDAQRSPEKSQMSWVMGRFFLPASAAE